MGTRNLTIVVQDNEYKVAQYGQWDGYPSGQGKTAVKFLLEDGNLEKLRNNLSKVRFTDVQGKDKEFFEAYNKNAPKWSDEPDNRTPEQIRWFKSYMTRDLGAEILKSIAESADPEIILRNELNFAADSLMCEWAYVLDLDNDRLEVYTGFNKKPLTETDRFYFLQEKSEGGYYPIKKLAEFPFSELNLNSMDSLEESEDEEEIEEAVAV